MRSQDCVTLPGCSSGGEDGYDGHGLKGVHAAIDGFTGDIVARHAMVDFLRGMVDSEALQLLG
jgi:hypothetical protein